MEKKFHRPYVIVLVLIVLGLMSGNWLQRLDEIYYHGLNSTFQWFDLLFLIIYFGILISYLIYFSKRKYGVILKDDEIFIHQSLFLSFLFLPARYKNSIKLTQVHKVEVGLWFYLYFINDHGNVDGLRLPVDYTEFRKLKRELLSQLDKI